jgi:hypothetical protein
VLDLRLDQKIDAPAVLALMHALRRGSGCTMELACTACCTARLQPPSADEFPPQDFGPKLNWEAPMGSDLVYHSVSRMER